MLTTMAECYSSGTASEPNVSGCEYYYSTAVDPYAYPESDTEHEHRS